jgi:ABC-type uncharacterized transport system involved in gliding motility auxiliary subunit
MKSILKNISQYIKDFKDGLEKSNKFMLPVIIIILLNVMGAFAYLRADLTNESIYSLSKESQKVVSELNDQLTVKVYFSSDLPAEINSAYRYLEDLLLEYRDLSSGDFSFEIVDMDEEDNKNEAEEYGIHQVTTREIKNDQAKILNVYNGVVIIYSNLIERIDNIQDKAGLEYKLTTKIKKITGKSNALIGLKDKIKMNLYASSGLTQFNISGLDKLEGIVKQIYEKVNSANYHQLEFKNVDLGDKKIVDQVAQKYGIQKITWKNLTLDGKKIVAGEAVLALVLEHNGRFQTIPLGLGRSFMGQYVVAGLDELEANLNKSIDYLISKSTPIAYIEGHGEAQLEIPRQYQQQGMLNFKQLVSEMYDIKKLDLKKDEISNDIKTIVINGPKTRYNEEELYKIDQFMMRGGSALFLIDSFNEIRPNQSNQMMMQMQQPVYIPINTGLEKMLSHYGVTVNRDYVLDTSCYVQRSQYGDMNRYSIPKIVKRNISEGSVITEYLDSLLFGNVSSLIVNEQKIKEQHLHDQVLISSSKKSWLMKGQIRLGPGIKPPTEKEMNKHDLAVLLEGKFNSFFTDNAPVGLKEKNKKSGFKTSTLIKKGVKKSKLIIVGTSLLTQPDFLNYSDNFRPNSHAPQMPQNAAFMINMIDYLNGNVDMPLMRSKGLASKSIEIREDQNRLRFFAKLLNIAGLPVLVILMGLFVWHKRTMHRKEIKNRFAGVHVNE